MSATSAPSVLDRKLPPVTEMGMVSLVLVIIGQIYLTAHLPKHVSLAPATILLIASAAVTVANVLWLAQAKGFHWLRFFQIARWSLLAYAVMAGLLEYVYLRNHLKGGPLVIMTLSLLVFAVQVPTLVGFTVARYYEPEDS